MSHRSKVLSPEQWDTIALLLPELMSPAPPWHSNRQLLEGIIWLLRSGTGWPDLPEHTLAHQRIGLDDVVGKKTGLGDGCGAP